MVTGPMAMSWPNSDQLARCSTGQANINQAADQNGYRVTAATSGRHAARLTTSSASG
jgi:hypothetical protein